MFSRHCHGKKKPLVWWSKPSLTFLFDWDIFQISSHQSDSDFFLEPAYSGSWKVWSQEMYETNMLLHFLTPQWTQHPSGETSQRARGQSGESMMQRNGWNMLCLKLKLGLDQSKVEIYVSLWSLLVVCRMIRHDFGCTVAFERNSSVSWLCTCTRDRYEAIGPTQGGN